MKEKKEENLPNDSPYEERECECGCGKKFLPKRSDQYFLDKRHANKAYNHGKRKQNSKNQIVAEKQLRLNDKILEKYNQSMENELVVVFSLNLSSDGFDHSFFIGNDLKEGLLYRKTYNYLFHEYEKDGRKLTRIIKQKKKVYVKR